MKIIKILKTDWARGMDKAREGYRLFGPVKGKTGHQFELLGKDLYPDMDYGETVLSPKSVLFPQTQTLLVSTKSCEDHHMMEQPTFDDTPRAVIGIRPCDAKAIELVRLNFDTPEYRDPYFCDAHGATTFVGLAVNTPALVDFSAAAGSGPFDEQGLDLLLVDCETAYLAKILTKKGEAFLDQAGFKDEQDPDAALGIIREMKKKAEAGSSSISTHRLREKNILDLHAAPFWEDLAFSCINCGTCTFVCPTCWCFDIQDETRGTLAQRIRNWDTCMSPLFTLHGSGHNPRGEKTQRVRQRFMHKLKYFLDKYDQGIMCVGCGRCVANCPVNIDIRTVCDLMNSYEPGDQTDAQAGPVETKG